MREKLLKTLICGVTLAAFMLSSVAPVYAQSIVLPAPGARVSVSQAFSPLMLKGIRVNGDDPFRMDFILDTGDGPSDPDQLKAGASRLIKYFLASLTIPENDLWVNLSPYEKERMIPEKFGQTMMGDDLLAQDYVLKQLASSLMYPQRDLGRKFWDELYAKAGKLYGTTDIPIDAFHKVWIVPERAEVYVHGDVALIVETHLKVMLEADYFALKKSGHGMKRDDDKIINATSDLMRSLILPEIEKEVNEGESFAGLRQIVSAMILATWFKQNLSETPLGRIYAEKNKVNGVNTDDLSTKEKIYQQYLQAIKAGVFNFIKEEYDENSSQVVPRRYFSGGYAWDSRVVHGARVDRKAMMIRGGETLAGNVLLVQVFNFPLSNGGRDQGGSDADPGAQASAREGLLAAVAQLQEVDRAAVRQEIDDDGNTVYSISEQTASSPAGRMIARLLGVLSFSGGRSAAMMAPGLPRGAGGIIAGFDKDLAQRRDVLKQELRYQRGGVFHGRDYGSGMSAAGAFNEVSGILKDFAMLAAHNPEDGFEVLSSGVSVWRPGRGTGSSDDGGKQDGIRGPAADYEKVSAAIRQQDRKPRVLLVQSHITSLNNFNPPLGLYYLKASLNKYSQAEVMILDLGIGNKKTNAEREERLKRVLGDFKPDIVGISFATASSSNAFKAADIVKETDPDIVLVAGGPHASAVSNRDMLRGTAFDVSFIREGERSFCHFVDAIHRSGSQGEILGVKGFSIKYSDGIYDTGAPDVIKDIDSLPFPSIPAADMARYNVWIVNPANQAVPILTTRGCPYGCVFCAKGVFGRALRKRSAQNIMEEIREYYSQGQRNFSFIDDGFSSDPKWLMGLCQAIIDSGLDIRWRASTRTNTMSPQLLRAMKRSGCIGVAFGIESGSQRILDTVIGKGTKVDTNLKAIQMAKDAGIEEVRLFIMLGLPGETEWDVRQTIEFVKRADPTNIGLSVAVPMPGSRWGGNPELYGTTVLGNADDFYPYRKKAATGTYTQDGPPIVHRTQQLDRDTIMHLYEVMREELARYMFEPEEVKAKFIAAEFAHGIEVLRKVGLDGLLETYGLTPQNAWQHFSWMAELIRQVNYPRWRRLNREPALASQDLPDADTENLDRENVLGLIVMHILSLMLGGEHDENLIMEMAVNGAAAENPLLTQIGNLGKIVHGAYLLVEDRISREQYDHLVSRNIKAINIPQLAAVAKRLQNIAHAIGRDAVLRLLKEAEEQNKVKGEDLVLFDNPDRFDTEQQEAVLMLKPPTTAGPDGKLNMALIGEVIDRIQGFGCDVTGLRLMGGAYWRQHPEKLQAFYSDAYQGYQDGVQDPRAMRRLREVYDRPDFARAFSGVSFGDTPVIPGLALVTQYGLTPEEVDQLWSGSRFPISIKDFEARYGVKVRIVDDPGASPAAGGELAVPRSLVLVEDGEEKINWYEQGLPYGVNKVGISTSVLPVVHPRVNNGKPVIIVNGYVPGLFSAFEGADGNKAIAIQVRPRIGSGVSLRTLREEFLGDESMPDRNPAGTLRRDALEGGLPLPAEQRPGLRGATNLAHLSAGPLEALKEIGLIFERPLSGVLFGQQLLESGYSPEQVQYLFTNPRVRSVVDGAARETTIFSLTSKESNEGALRTIRKYFPPYRTQDVLNTPSVSFVQHRRIIDAGPSLAGNRLSRDRVRPSSRRLTDIDALTEEENRENDRVGNELIEKGEIAVIIGAGGEGGRVVGYEVDDPALRDKVHSTVLQLNIDGRVVEVNLAQVRAAHVKGVQKTQTPVRNIPVFVMGNDRNLSHVEQTWNRSGYYGLGEQDVSFYAQNGIYRFNPSRRDILLSGKVLKELEKVHEQKIRYGLIPPGTRFDPEKAVDEVLVRNGRVGDFFRTDDGVISTKPAGHLEMLLQPFLNGRLAYLAERGCKVLLIPNGDDMGFHIDRRRLGHFYRSGKGMMVTLTEKREGEEGGFLFDVDQDGDGHFRPQVLEKDNVPSGFDYSGIRYISTGQNLFNIEQVLEFFLRGGSLKENLRRYYNLTQEERLELANRMLAPLHFNLAIKPVRVGTDFSDPDHPVPIMSAAAQLERLVGNMSQVLDTEFIVVPRDGNFGPIKDRSDEEPAARMIEQLARNGVPYVFAPIAASTDAAQSTDLGGIDLNPKYLDLLVRGKGLDTGVSLEYGEPFQIDGLSPVILQIGIESFSSIIQ
jgi:radical SAM superfamily enzyme YgiQ (UPF0313 family)